MASRRRGAVKFFSPAQPPVALFALQHFRRAAEHPQVVSATPVAPRWPRLGFELAAQENPHAICFGLRWSILARRFSEKLGDHAPDIEIGVEVPEARNPVRPGCVPIVLGGPHKVPDGRVGRPSATKRRMFQRLGDAGPHEHRYVGFRADRFDRWQAFHIELRNWRASGAERGSDRLVFRCRFRARLLAAFSSLLFAFVGLRLRRDQRLRKLSGSFICDPPVSAVLAAPMLRDWHDRVFV